MLDVKSLNPEQIAILSRFMDASIKIQVRIAELHDAMMDTAEAVAVELGMERHEGSNILLAAAEKAYIERMSLPED